MSELKKMPKSISHVNRYLCESKPHKSRTTFMQEVTSDNERSRKRNYRWNKKTKEMLPCQWLVTAVIMCPIYDGYKVTHIDSYDTNKNNY